MITKVLTMPRDAVLKMIEQVGIYDNIKGSWALISIYTDNDILSNIKATETLVFLGCKDFISVRFSDITKEDMKGHHKELILFNEEHAQKIIDFVNKVKDSVDTLVVQCAAGISRSGAVGAFVCRYLNMDTKVYYKENHVLPNMHILNVLTEVSGLNRDYIKFWEDDRIIKPDLQKRLDQMFRR